ncbi:MAG: bifunctional DNA-formamidopyrimidine glycosylase/DNA-(apurinic or apyrimidinic site) lyase [Burkholderiales bacterium]|nr:bifunctional DNA-formamidopyrimidine glycosylase/DNA-(apurinic or apyrimidinic site) lyase [Burkholderiales bacterium]
MPELPEVETTRLGLLPKVQGGRISTVTVRDRRLRWPIPKSLAARLIGKTVNDIARRGKYLLWDVRESNANRGYLLSHLGMSGSLRLIQTGDTSSSPLRHDHLDIAFDNGVTVRYTDPRRFGAMLWIGGALPVHPLLDSLGPEPLSADFDGTHLYNLAKDRSVSVKEFIMNSRVVVGVGNIYASEALFRAGIHPKRMAGKVSRIRMDRLADAIKHTLEKAIHAGGSSLRNYVQASGELGYFQVNAFVYGRDGLSCRTCQTPIRTMRQGQRSTYFCPGCQT